MGSGGGRKGNGGHTGAGAEGEPRLRAAGVPLREAIVEANHTRLRPILMTTFAIVAGLIPTSLGIGVGSAQRSAIAVTIIGGQTLCLLLTLLVVPVTCEDRPPGLSQS